MLCGKMAEGVRQSRPAVSPRQAMEQIRRDAEE
jgi:hypothetical protein